MDTKNELNIDEIHAAIMAHIPESNDWTELDRREASSLINAVLVSLLGLETHPHEVKENLVGFENGYGCWLDEVEQAVHKGLADLPQQYTDLIKGQVIGAFHMGKAFLFDIEGHNEKFEKIERERVEEQAKQARREEGAYPPDFVR